MHSKVIAASILFILLAAGVGHAQTEELQDPGMLPDNPFYFAKRWTEGLGTLLTFNPVARAERHANLAERRLAEARALVEKGREDLAERSAADYQQNIERAFARAEEARARGLETEELIARVSEATLRHQVVLADVYERVPEQAKEAIERAMEAGLRGHEEALRALSGEQREEALQRAEEARVGIEERLESLREQGVPIPALPDLEAIRRAPAEVRGIEGATMPVPGATNSGLEMEVEEEDESDAAPGRSPAGVPTAPGGRP